jgi:hypothetical protein
MTLPHPCSYYLKGLVSLASSRIKFHIIEYTPLQRLGQRCSKQWLVEPATVFGEMAGMFYMEACKAFEFD